MPSSCSNSASGATSRKSRRTPAVRLSQPLLHACQHDLLTPRFQDTTNNAITGWCGAAACEGARQPQMPKVAWPALWWQVRQMTHVASGNIPARKVSGARKPGGLARKVVKAGNVACGCKFYQQHCCLGRPVRTQGLLTSSPAPHHVRSRRNGGFCGATMPRQRSVPSIEVAPPKPQSRVPGPSLAATSPPARNRMRPCHLRRPTACKWHQSCHQGVWPHWWHHHHHIHADAFTNPLCSKACRQAAKQVLRHNTTRDLRETPTLATPGVMGASSGTARSVPQELGLNFSLQSAAAWSNKQDNPQPGTLPACTL